MNAHAQPSLDSERLIRAVEDRLGDLLEAQPDARLLSVDRRLVEHWIHLLAVARGPHLWLAPPRFHLI
jgi:hypothetical protein